MDKRKQDVMRSWHEAIKLLPDDAKLEALAALADYAISGSLPQLSPMAMQVFNFMACVMKVNVQPCSGMKEKAKKAEPCHDLTEKGKNADSCHGLTEMDKNADSCHEAAEIGCHETTEVDEPSLFGSPSRVSPSHASLARVIGNNINNKDSLDNINNQKIKKENAQKKEKEDAQKKEKEEMGDADVLNVADKVDGTVDARVFIEYFNVEMGNAGSVIPHNVKYTRMRAAAINSRCREHGRTALAEMVHKAARSDFLNGRNSNNWTASFDWLLRPNNFVKVIEGNYDNNRFANGNFSNGNSSNGKNNSSNGNKNFNDYGNGNKSDPRRGFEPIDHTAEEYAEMV